MDIAISTNISYCVGVQRTLNLVEELIRKNPEKTFYMLGEIVHNEFVIHDLESRGLRIVRSLEAVPERSNVIIQSHGASQAAVEHLRAKKARIIDATCPMVKLIHKKIVRLVQDGYFPVIIGRKGHDEVMGIAGQVQESIIVGSAEEVRPESFDSLSKVGIVIQSTYVRSDALAIVDRIKALVPEVKLEDTICRPTTDRQEEVRRVADEFDCIVIVGSKTSANTRHLYELASGHKACVYLVDDPDQVPRLAIPPESSIFVTSGASTPMFLVERVLSHLQDRDRITA